MKMWLTTLTAVLSLNVAANSYILDDNLAYQLTESLTVEVGPRLAGSPGDTRAVAWAERTFKQLGFDKVWSEPFSMQYWERGQASLSVSAPFSQNLVVTALGGSVATPFDGIKITIRSNAIHGWSCLSWSEAWSWQLWSWLMAWSWPDGSIHGH